MTPKEKAEKLVDKFISEGQIHKYMGVEDATQCALITVDEMIAQCEDANFGGFSLYWESVKQELLNLQNNV